MKKRPPILEYLALSHRERTGILIVAGLVLIFFILPRFLPGPGHAAGVSQADTAWLMAMKRMEQTAPPQQDYSQNREGSYPEAHYSDPRITTRKTEKALFHFDPNQLDEEGWRALGLREKTIKTILNYISKGGQFRKPEDLKRIYGLFPDEYERLAPWIRMGSAPDSKVEAPATFSQVETSKTTARNTRFTPVDINLADTSSLIALPGIGSKLAARIISFRDKLGGFYTVEQVGETYGLADSVFRELKKFLLVTSPVLRKININTAGAEELKAHPYIRWALANPLLAYRKEHGLFSTVEDIRKLQAVTDEQYKKLAPYLVVQ